MADDDLEWLYGQAQAVTVKEDDWLMREGEEGDACYIVLDGEFDITKRSDQQEIKIAQREPGARALLARDFEEAFADVDVIAGPTSPTPAFKLGEKVDDPVAMYLCDILTTPTSLAGLPGISVPIGFVEESGRKLPVGLQIVGPWKADARVLRVARAYELATEYSKAAPPLATMVPPRAGSKAKRGGSDKAIPPEGATRGGKG
jgi:Asp-tRNA(Asn)/Glu-tRNA(Gln) amidotransferase A subunit family amidase